MQNEKLKILAEASPQFLIFNFALNGGCIDDEGS
jgi:hypothetical protein